MTKPQISDPPHDTLGQVGSTTCDPDYDVGYGRPPEHGKIKPGEVRNPRGNRKGTRSHKAEAQAMLKMPVPMTGPDGKTRKVTTHEAALLSRLDFVRLCGGETILKLRGNPRAQITNDA